MGDRPVDEPRYVPHAVTDRRSPTSRIVHELLPARRQRCRAPFADLCLLLRTVFALTYATRTTAGFPLSFPPVSYSAMSKAFKRARPCERVPSSNDFALDHLREHQLSGRDFSPDRAWMIDGGVLDNKPFELVARAIERKPPARQVYRTVMYVEPNPKSDVEGPPCHAPRIGKVASGLYRVFRHEPIYEDLRRHRERNAWVARIREIAEAALCDGRRAAKKAGERAGFAGGHARSRLTYGGR